MSGLFAGPLFAGMTDEHRARAVALAQHNPPREIWLDPSGGTEFRCITDEPNRDCPGCRAAVRPPGPHWLFTPPSTMS